LTRDEHIDFPTIVSDLRQQEGQSDLFRPPFQPATGKVMGKVMPLLMACKKLDVCKSLI
jgi:hypothetical protein